MRLTSLLIFRTKPTKYVPICVVMASSLDRLEKLFSSARRKNKVVQEKKAAKQQHERTFPSPSFLRPTSIQMMPRDARGQDCEGVTEDRGRTYSLPEPNPNDEWPSSTLLSLYHDHHDKAQAEPLRDFLSTAPEPGVDTSIAPRLSEFKFPEDALFRHDEILRISGEVSPRPESSKTTPDEIIKKGEESPRDRRSLDHPLTHISSQLNVGKPRLGATLRVGKSGEAEPHMLLPSPIITRSGTVTRKRTPSTSSAATLTSPTSPTSPSKQVFESKFSLFPKQRSREPFHVPQVDSPPASDGEEDHAIISTKRPVSTSSLPTPDRSTTSSLGSPSRLQIPGSEENRCSKRDTWEAWGHRVDDPISGIDFSEDTKDEDHEGGVKLQPVRRSSSAATLSVLTGHGPKENILREPTIEEFYALSDEALAEPLLASPILNPHSTPELPPKDTDAPSLTPPELYTKRNSATGAVTSQSTGEMTPPYTPKDPRFLAMDSTRHDVIGAQGAIWCARIADKYHFDMIYVVSLWPKAAGSKWDPSCRPLAESPIKSIPGAALRNCPVELHPKSAITGRLLAGYGLGEVITPFQIATKPHLKLLISGQWEEYHNKPDSEEDISHGWAHAFYSDYVPVVGAEPCDQTGSPSKIPDPNRGIVFGAYVKHKNRINILGKQGPEKQAHFDRILADVRTLIDALVVWA